MTKLDPYEYLRLQKTREKVQTVSDVFIGQQCIFFYKEDWVFDFSLEASLKNWEVTQQVYFRNARKHQSLAFALPYIVVQLRFADAVKISSNFSNLWRRNYQDGWIHGSFYQAGKGN